MDRARSPGLEALEHQLTQRDLEFTPDDGNRHEIIDGVLFVSPFPTYPHQAALQALLRALDVHVHAHGLGKIFPAGLKVVLDEPTGVGPDLTFVSAARMQHMRRDGYYGPPDLLVEILFSRPQLDRLVKLNKYAQAGVPHYWIVDPDERLLDAYRLEGGRYALAVELRGEVAFTPQLFPGLVIDLRELWV